MTIEIHGRARRCGDDINTDYIIASSRKRETLDETVLKQYLLEAVDPAFAASVRPGDILVAGRDFGCGSAMEIAVTVLLAAGIRAVVAQSFARTFFRNAINNGMLPVECDTGRMAEGDTLAVRVDAAGTQVVLADGASVAGARFAPVVLQLLAAGGLAPYVRGGGLRLPL